MDILADSHGQNYAPEDNKSCTVRPRELLEIGIDCAKRGWSIIPTHGKKPHPICQQWGPYKKHRPDESRLREWFAGDLAQDLRPDGLAVILGEVSGGLTCRDFDQAENYHLWAKTHSGLARELPTVRTRRGFHVYARTTYRRILTLDDGELRGNGYCVLPPSLHPSGIRYEWLVPPSEAVIPALDPFAEGLAKSPDRPKHTQQTQANPLTPIACASLTVEHAISATMPTAVGQRNHKIFDFARLLKAIRPDASRSELRDFLRQWHGKALPIIGTKAFAETWTDFVVAWGRIITPAGASFAAACAKARTTCAPQEGLIYDDALMHELVTLCFCLQQIAGDEPFYLGCREAAQFLGVTPKTAWAMLKTLRFDEIIVRVTKGKKATRTTEGKNSEYRFLRQPECGGDQ